MQIKITKTINISKENEGLLTVVAKNRGYVEGDVYEFITDFLTKEESFVTRGMIEPAISTYFGEVMKDKAIEVIGLLPEAIQVNVEIIN